MQRVLIKFPLRSRIAASFSIAGSVAVIVFALSWWSIDEGLERFRRFAALSERTRFELEVAQSVSELQRHVQSYATLGHEAAAASVEAEYQEVSKALSEHAANSEEVAPELAQIATHLGVYFDTFETLQQHRARRTELADELELAGARAERALVGLGNVGLQDFLRARLSAQRYFDRLDVSEVEATKAALGRLDALLTRAGPSAAARDARAAAHAYQARFVEAVQRTRGYLFLVNVVMAAEAYEILYATRQLERRNRVHMAEESKAARADLERSAQTITVVVVVTLLGLLALSAGLYRSITEPIVRLSTTFRELAKGRRDLVVPAYGARDEIGELTAAATVFRNKNIETQSLLSQAQALTAELEDKQTALARSSEELEQFVYTVSHDLKSPLVTSMGFITIAKRLAQRGQFEEATEKLDRVIKANERMGALINDLLDLSRVGRTDVELATISLAVLLEDLRSTLEPRLRRAGLALVLQDNLPPVRANESRLLQVFENLVNNAMKYAAAPAGSRIEIGFERGLSALLVYVDDDGPGIPPEYHEKVFGIFQRLDTSGSGTGIGLTAVRKIMQFHGGDAWVESPEEGGARFWLRFPIPEGETEGATA